MYEGFATKEMLQKRWRKDAEYEVCSNQSTLPSPVGLITELLLTPRARAGPVHEV